MTRKKTTQKAQIVDEQPEDPISRNQIILLVVQRSFSLFKASLWPLCVVACAYCMVLCVRALAGRVTYANILSDVVFNWGLDKIVAYVVGVGGATYGLHERRLRIESLKTERARNIGDELAIDKDRSTSGLLPGGLTPEES